jgi:signal transduction histidine kinase
MTRSADYDFEQSTARCRIVLSIVAMIAISIDPTPSAVSRWIGSAAAGPVTADPYTLAVMGAHLIYSLSVYVAVAWRRRASAALTTWTIWADVIFAAAIAFCTEGMSSPFYAFFAFAVVAVGLRAGFRRALLVTAVSVAVYLSLLIVSHAGDLKLYIVRPVYLAVIGYLVAYLGRERLELEAQRCALETAEERARIARDLHDGCVQTLAGVNLRLESCRELLRRGRGSAALADLAELQASVNSEYDGLRTYMRSLAGQDLTSIVIGPHDATRLSVNMVFSGSATLVDHVLQILRESVTNVRRHARARWASVRVRSEGADVVIDIDDDGVGLHGSQRPWSITSRVRELNGLISVRRESEAGAHLSIALPRA